MTDRNNLTNDEVSLKPCPFCGAPASFTPETERRYATVMCSECPCDMELAGIPEREVIAAWNRRSPEPTPERQGMKIGCNGCDAAVVLAFTDATKKAVDINAIEGWTAGPGGTWCPRCSLNRPGDGGALAK
jgi:Lar family restriction alleviation protein